MELVLKIINDNSISPNQYKQHKEKFIEFFDSNKFNQI